MLSTQLATLASFLRGDESSEKALEQDLPLRSELYSAEQLEQYGLTLAGWHRVSVAYSHNQLLWRLSENERVLTAAVKLLADTVKENIRITPAGEWLLDNFYLVEEQIRLAKKHLPYGYSRELPHVLNGPYAGMPRVYNLALEAISHGDGKIDLRNLSRFVASYQSVTKLKLGELWAIPIMLRLALIENLRRVAARISADKKDRQRADVWADQMIKVAESDPKSLILVVADMARSDPPMVSSFVAELTRRLQGHGPALALPLTWIEQRLAENGLTIEQLVQSQTQQQAADQVSVSNSIGSLRVLGATDWRRFVETNSAVEETLRKDPSGIYEKMDFNTRDQYRHVVEKICKANKGLAETDLAASVLELAQEAASKAGIHSRFAHVGYYLVGKGRAQTERTNGLQKSILPALLEIIHEHPLFCYLGTILAASAALTFFLLQKIQTDLHPEYLLILLLIVIALGSSQLALALVNWLLTLFATPQQIPKMDFSGGIPAEATTLVAVPTMLVSESRVEELLEALEVRFAANQDENLYFALLTDFPDAAEETKPGDEALVKLAEEGIGDLNKKHGRDCFFLFHRSRVWNPNEKVWMGYERKRGKLSALHSFILGVDAEKQNRFSLVSGKTENLSKVKYVITLDTDTQLPRDSARELVGAMMHPLNKAIYDEQKQRVTEGYCILQPRVALSLSGDSRSLYSTLFGSEKGIDPYTCTVSDVYQDIFAEGSFIGKGIYELGVFEQVLRNRFPENCILSHDLIEGCFLRSALLTDVQLYEKYPSSYSADMTRKYRWIRGDWQLLNWLFPLIPLADGRWQKNPLSALSKWKLFDNLRRSLLPPALLLLLVIGWTLLDKPWFWSVTVLAFVTVPFLVASAVSLLRKPGDMQINQHLDSAWQTVIQDLAQAFFTMAQLPYEAYLNLKAIVCTCWRILVSRRRLLEWVTSSQAEANSSSALSNYCSAMVIAPVAALATFFYLLQSRPEALPSASAILLLWLLAPVLAWKASKTMLPQSARLSDEQFWFLRKLSRKTWAFFEVFAGADDNWLPPDNYQESPVERIAHRTSPTNMGFSLLANLSAYDFGYIQAGEFIDRTEKAFQTLSKLDRHRGHFFNWYDTQTLESLHPQYVSTVDSGNLAGDLLTLRPGLLELTEQAIVGPRLFDGLRDTTEILLESIETEAPGFSQFRLDMQSALDGPSQILASIKSLLFKLSKQSQELAFWYQKNGNEESVFWSRSLARQCANASAELAYLAPWLRTEESIKLADGQALLTKVMTLEELARLDLSNQSLPEDFVQQVQLGSLRAAQRLAKLKTLAAQSSEFAAMDFEFLYDKSRHLLSIGFNAEQRRLDTSYYDLLASEARLCNFIAIAHGQLPQESWFSLGRLLAAASGEPALMSWSGSMFEYLMPLLLMPNFENTLLDQTYKAVIKRQKAYGIANGVPWGVSESGYSAVDGQSNYQYRAFGVPGLGLKRGLSEDLVIAPYASALALMVAAEDACQNLQALSAAGFENRYGFYEAIDYTRSRLPRGKTHVLVQSYMAHHQGMTFLSLAYLLLGKKMQERFQSDPAIQATTLLLQERIPKTGVHHLESDDLTGVRLTPGGEEQTLRAFRSPNTQFPELQLLSNSRYHLMMTNAGGGYSRWNDIALTRWTEDSTCDNSGSFCYVRDLSSGEFWSVTYQPTKKKADEYEAVFSDSRIEFRRRDKDLLCYTELVVSSEDDIELRRVRITNHSSASRIIDVTSYAEIVLAPPVGDALHPAFSKLFVQTEIIEQRQAILCTRRARSPEEQSPWMFHLLTVQARKKDSMHISYETDRSKFIGRGNTLESPEAMIKASPLSGSHGSVLDPVVAIRCYITLEPEGEATFNFITGVAGTRETATLLLEKYSDRNMSDRVFDLAWSHSQALLHQLNANESDSQVYSRLASAIIFANAAMRADASTLIKNKRGQSGLWSFSISGDLPIVLVKIRNQDNIELVRQLIQAHAYWRIKGLAVDLVIWNEDHAGYRQQLQEQILALLSSGAEANLLDRPGGIFIRAAEQISEEDSILLHSVARAIISDNRGTLEEQLNRRPAIEQRVAALKPGTSHRQQLFSAGALRRDLILGNGLGGFTSDGREYIITTSHEQRTPAPWCNILANPYFGCIISDSGSGYTWCENAHEYRLSPWSNDPVCDASGEALYIRDEQTGYFWSPTPLPATGSTPYVTRHGFGYTAFEHAEDGIVTELWVHVAIDAPVKFYTLKIRNASGRSRSLSSTMYIEWVLGDLRSKSAMHISTELDARTGAMFARNPYNTEFARRVAFLDVDSVSSRGISGDRSEFVGRNRTLKRPAAMFASRLSGRVGAGLDPCGAMQIHFELADGEVREFVFRIGSATDTNDAVTLVRRFRGAGARLESFEAACHYWKHTLGAVNIDTSDNSLNMLVNGWLLYQTIACRLYGRSGFYQSGGAFGFRDQLQDTMALIHADPRLLREQLVRSSGRQFHEGDVQHWWHPPSGRGVRTRCSDDYLWLPLAVQRYVECTGDTGVLDEMTPFLEGRKVNPDEDSYYDLPVNSEQKATLYEHCVRAIKNGLRFGSHGLPLILTGDWNDGMNLVGEKGKGESVWLGFFLYHVLLSFSRIAQMRNDSAVVELCQTEAARLRSNLQEGAWDGKWFRRAYFDDGTPLGSAQNEECKIDSIAQSWSVLSGAADLEFSKTAMNSLSEHLVRHEDALIQLLDPPFDKSSLNPGYIRGYVPGVRENGGQYTHGAIWAAMAFAALGDQKRAWELLSMINPINHASSPAGINTYKVEPYVMAADVYGVAPHTGRGGWTWYTGSGAWMYRFIVESLLGITLEVDKLRISPCLPAHWTEYKVHYRYRETVHHITIRQVSPTEQSGVFSDNQRIGTDSFKLHDDGQEHFVELRIAPGNA